MTGILCIFVFLLPLVYSSAADDHFFLPKYALVSCFSLLFLFTGLFLSAKQSRTSRSGYFFLLYVFLFMINSFVMLIFDKIQPPAAVIELTVVLAGMVFYTFRNHLHFEKSFDWMILSADLVCIIGILQYYGVHFLLPEWGVRGFDWTRKNPIVYSTFGNPNYLCNFLTPLIPFLLNGLVTTENAFRKIWHFLSFIVISLTIILSFSRAGILNLAAGVVLYFAFFMLKKGRLPLRSALWVSGVLGFLSLGFALFFFESPFNKGYGYNQQVRTLKDRFLKKTGSIQKRLVLWKNSVRLISRYPVTGIGDGNFASEMVKIQADFFPHAPDLDKAYWSYAKRAHNMFLQKLVDKGLPVGLVFILFNLSLLISSLKKSGETDRSCFLALLILLSQGMVSFPLMLPVSAVLYYMLSAALLRDPPESGSRSGDETHCLNASRG